MFQYKSFLSYYTTFSILKYISVNNQCFFLSPTSSSYFVAKFFLRMLSSVYESSAYHVYLFVLDRRTCKHGCLAIISVQGSVMKESWLHLVFCQCYLWHPQGPNYSTIFCFQSKYHFEVKQIRSYFERFSVFYSFWCLAAMPMHTGLFLLQVVTVHIRYEH